MGVLIIDYVALTPILLIASAFALPLFSLFIKRKVFYDIYAFIATLIAFILTLQIAVCVCERGYPALYPFGGWPPPIGILYEVDAFSAILGVLVSGIILVIVVYSWWYLKKVTGHAWYYALLLGMEVGMLGCLYTGDIFNLFVMIEVLAITAYSLVAFYRSKLIALEASMKYAFIGAVATTLYFVAVLFIYGAYGTLNMADIAIRARTIPPRSIWDGLFVDEFSRNVSILAISALISTILVLWTITYKAAIFPNHFWLPDAHPEAPTPISAALSSVVVGIGAYIAIRWFYTIFGPDSILNNVLVFNTPARDMILYILMFLGAISSILGALLMVVQRDVKRLLAYSTISHMGLIIMTISTGLGTVSEITRTLALTAATYHLINHALGKALLFLATGILIIKAGTRDLTRWNGVGKTALLASATLVIGALHLIGIPPLGGFFSKLMMFQSFILSNMVWLVIVLILESGISIVGYIKLINATIYGKPEAYKESSNNTSVFPYTSLLILAAACIASGMLYVSGHVPTYLVDYISESLGSDGIVKYIDAAKEFITWYLGK